MFEVHFAKRNVTFYTALLLALGLTFTPFYGVVYIVAIAVAAKKLDFGRLYSSMLSRAVLTALLLAVSIMLAGTLTWAVSISVYPILTLIVFGAIIALLLKLRKTPAVSPAAAIDRPDILSLLLAGVAVAMLALSFYLPKPTSAASIQVLTNGYDNTAHLSLLQTTGIENGYVYGPYLKVRDKTLSGLNAYPQGWHLATSHMMNGFGIDFFEPTKPLRSTNAYLGALAIWYVITVYLFSRLAWFIAQSIKGKQRSGWQSTLSFVLGNLLIQLLVFWGSLTFGFASYICCLAYLLVIAASVIEFDRRNAATSFVMIALATVAVTQSWLLPLPAIIALMGLLFLKDQHPRELLSQLRKPSMKLLIMAVVAFLCLLASLFQIYVLFAFNTGSTRDQFSTDGGIFPLSNLLIGTITLFTIVFWFKVKSRLDDMAGKMLALLLPFAFLCFGIYVYQIFMTEHTSYYFIKSIAIFLMLVGLFFIPAAQAVIGQLSILPSRGRFTEASLAVLAFTVLVMGCGQTTFVFNSFFQRYSRITYQTALTIEDYLAKRGKKTNDRVVILRDNKFEEDSDGTYFTNRAARAADNCLGSVTYMREIPINQRVNKIDACANLVKGDLVVITSNHTKSSVDKISDTNIKVVNVP